MEYLLDFRYEFVPPTRKSRTDAALGIRLAELVENLRVYACCCSMVTAPVIRFTTPVAPVQVVRCSLRSSWTLPCVLYFESEDDRWQNRIENLWIEIDDRARVSGN
jgi:hypothetical protein